MERVWQRLIAAAQFHKESGTSLSDAEARGIVKTICADESVAPGDHIINYLAWAMARRTRA